MTSDYAGIIVIMHFYYYLLYNILYCYHRSLHVFQSDVHSCYTIDWVFNVLMYLLPMYNSIKYAVARKYLIGILKMIRINLILAQNVWDKYLFQYYFIYNFWWSFYIFKKHSFIFCCFCIDPALVFRGS